MSKQIGIFGAIVALATVLSACAPTPAPVKPRPVAKYQGRPYPPMGASPNLATPQALADGTRQTVNSNLSPEQTAWNLRSAFNVAALNCQKPEHAPILTSYGDFLRSHKSELASINRSLDNNFRNNHGKSYIRKREATQTQVYNYFALPPTIPALCNATLAMGQDLKAVSRGRLTASAPAALAKLEAIFLEFFDSYDRYQRDFVQWQRDYIAKYNAAPSDGYFLPGEPRYTPQP